MADPYRFHTDDRAVARNGRQGPLLETERRVEVVEHDGAHGAILRPRSTGAARASPPS